jgi:hypothetical protein
LWTVLLAGFLKLGLPAEIMSRVLGAGFAIGTLVVVVRMARRIGGDSLWNVVAPLLLAGCGGYACWSSGGLETALFTFLVTLGFARHLEGRRGAAVWFALAAMTRPEGNLFFALAMLHRLLVSRERRIDLTTIGIYLGLYVPYFAWRWHYYGWLFPNTFYIKSSGGQGTFGRGVFYLWQFFKDYGVWFVVPLVVPPAARTWRVWTLAVLVVVGFGLYVASVGGDFMGLYRFLIPALPLLAPAAQEALTRLGNWIGARAAIAVAVVFVASYAAWTVRVTYRANTIVRDDPPGSGIDMPAYLRRFTADRALVGKWFGQYTKPDDLMSVGGSGAQVYYADVSAIDAFGLNDEFIAHKVPSRGNRPGHQKWAPDSYILSRHPTIMCHLYKITAQPYRPSPPEAASWRAQGWRWVSARIPGLDPPYYNFLLRRDRSLGPFGADLSP